MKCDTPMYMYKVAPSQGMIYFIGYYKIFNQSLTRNIKFYFIFIILHCYTIMYIYPLTALWNTSESLHDGFFFFKVLILSIILYEGFYREHISPFNWIDLIHFRQDFKIASARHEMALVAWILKQRVHVNVSM